MGGICFYSEVEQGYITGCSAKFLSANTRKRPLVSVHMCCSVGMAALVAVTFPVELVVITFSSCMEIPQNYTCAETSRHIFSQGILYTYNLQTTYINLKLFEENALFGAGI